MRMMMTKTKSCDEQAYEDWVREILRSNAEETQQCDTYVFKDSNILIEEIADFAVGGATYTEIFSQFAPLNLTTSDVRFAVKFVNGHV